jgi:hypothetical protein
MVIIIKSLLDVEIKTKPYFTSPNCCFPYCYNYLKIREQNEFSENLNFGHMQLFSLQRNSMTCAKWKLSISPFTSWKIMTITNFICDSINGTYHSIASHKKYIIVMVMLLSLLLFMIFKHINLFSTLSSEKYEGTQWD